MGFKMIPAPIVEKQLRNSPAMTRFLAGVGKEIADAVEEAEPDWIKTQGKEVARGGARINGGNVEGYVAVVSPFWHIPEFGTAVTPAEAPLRRMAASVIRSIGGDLKEQDQ